MKHLQIILMCICGVLLISSVVGFSIGVFMMSSKIILTSSSMVFMAVAFYIMGRLTESQ
jgi:hypothetical protein